MKKVIDLLKGRKTYVVVLAAVIFAITGYYTNNLTSAQAVEFVLGALGLGSLRNAIK